MTRNVALVAHAPKLRSISKWNSMRGQLRNFRRFCVRRLGIGSSLRSGFWPTPGSVAVSCSACSWDDVDLAQATTSINRGLVSVGYEVLESRGKTTNSRRLIDLDATTVRVLSARKAWQASERGALIFRVG